MPHLLATLKNLFNKSLISKIKSKLNFTFAFSTKTKIMVYKFRVILIAEEDVFREIAILEAHRRISLLEARQIENPLRHTGADLKPCFILKQNSNQHFAPCFGCK